MQALIEVSNPYWNKTVVLSYHQKVIPIQHLGRLVRIAKSTGLK
jgi:hypothetical protein